MEKIAVLIPCYNESLTINKVIQDFRKELPEAEIYVYDNNSNDNTSEVAGNSGAKVKFEYRQGKGNVVRTMFRQIDADCYVMVDGDDTYPAEAVHKLIAPIISDQADMVVGDRLSNKTYQQENKRRFHSLGNNLVRKVINTLFHTNLSDIMSGYRVFNRLFVKNMPVMSPGFEVETEMTLHALDKKFRITEIPIVYKDRPKGSHSKLKTIPDGIKVLKSIITIFKDYKPFKFFGSISLFFFFIGLLCGLPVIIEFINSGIILHVPLAILAAAIEILAAISIVCALILDTLVKQNKELYELHLIAYENSTKFLNKP